jgi:hypothetical protein
MKPAEYHRNIAACLIQTVTVYTKLRGKSKVSLSLAFFLTKSYNVTVHAVPAAGM